MKLISFLNTKQRLKVLSSRPPPPPKLPQLRLKNFFFCAKMTKIFPNSCFFNKFRRFFNKFLGCDHPCGQRYPRHRRRSRSSRRQQRTLLYFYSANLFKKSKKSSSFHDNIFTFRNEKKYYFQQVGQAIVDMENQAQMQQQMDAYIRWRRIQWNNFHKENISGLDFDQIQFKIQHCAPKSFLFLQSIFFFTRISKNFRIKYIILIR